MSLLIRPDRVKLERTRYAIEELEAADLPRRVRHLLGPVEVHHVAQVLGGAARLAPRLL
jgi:hypothetical protein